MQANILDATESSAWSDFVASHPQGHFMQSPEWGAHKGAHGWKSDIVTVREGREIRGGTLVLSKRVPAIGKTILYSPRGPLFQGGSPEALACLVAEMKKLAKREGAIFWRIDPYIRQGTFKDENPFVSAGFRSSPLEWSYWNGSKYLMILDISQGADKLFAGLTSKMRSRIRTPSKSGVQVHLGTASDMPAFMKTMTLTAQKKGIPVRDQRSYETLYRIFKKNERINLYLAKKGDEVISSGMSIHYGNKAWLMYLSSDYSIKESSRALQWEMVKQAADSGCIFYDFLGTATGYPPKETDKGYGVYLFKKSFGAELTALVGYYDYVFDPLLHRLFSVGEHKLLPLGERLFLSKFNLFVLLNKRRNKKENHE